MGDASVSQFGWVGGGGSPAACANNGRRRQGQRSAEASIGASQLPVLFNVLSTPKVEQVSCGPISSRSGTSMLTTAPAAWFLATERSNC